MAVGLEESVQAIPEWKIDFVRKYREHGEFKFGEMSKFMKDIALAHDLPEKKVSNFYYQQFKKDDGESIEKQINELFSVERIEPEQPKEKPAASTPAASKPTPWKDDQVALTQDELERLVALDIDKFVIKDGDYQKGKVVECRVVDLRDYGVMVETTDGFNTKGLIHITQMRVGEFVPNVEKFFRYNDIVRALILEYEADKDRLKLSTRHMPMKAYPYFDGNPSVKPHGTTVTIPSSHPVTPANPPVNPMADKLVGVKDKIAARVEEPKAPAAPVKPVAAEPNDDLYQIKSHLNGLIGAVTPAAEDVMNELIKKHGLFKFTMALMQTQGEFKPDLGLILMKEIDSKIGGSL